MAQMNKTMTQIQKDILHLYEELEIYPKGQKIKCSNFSSCQRSLKNVDHKLFFSGWPYIGKHYAETTISGKKASVLVISMDLGGKGQPTSDFLLRQNEWSNAFLNKNNPHTGGTDSIIKFLVDGESPGKYVDQFALINAVKCSPETGDMKSVITNIMQNNCSHCLSAEIEVLKPNFIITQGYAKDMLKEVLQLNDSNCVETYTNENEERPIEIYVKKKITVVTMPHPARQKGLNWKSDDLPHYFIKALAKSKKIFHGKA
jgi:uracil-DNA glycosylase